MTRRPRAPRADGRLKIGELAQHSGTPKETIHYYLRLGLLSPPLETSRNMAYYGARHLDELRLIARLRAESYLPLDKIKLVLEEERRAVSARSIDLAGDLFGRGARLVVEPVDARAVAERGGLPPALVDAAVEAGVLGGEAGFGWEDLRIAEVIAEARGAAHDEALIERLHIIDAHVRRMVEDELGHFFALMAAGLEPDRGLELLHGGRQTIGRYLALARARHMRAGLERAMAEVAAVARRPFVPAQPLPVARREALGEPAVRARLWAAHRAQPDDRAARAALLDHLLLQAEFAEALALARARPREDGAEAAEACVELARYDEALAWLEPLRAAGAAPTPRAEVVWAAAVLARARDVLAAPRATGEPAWAALSRLRGDRVRDLLAALVALARAAHALDAARGTLEAARARVLLGRVYVGTPPFLGLRPAAHAALSRADAELGAVADDPGLGVVERLRALVARERGALEA